MVTTTNLGGKVTLGNILAQTSNITVDNQINLQSGIRFQNPQPTNGQVLTWNGTIWAPATGATTFVDDTFIIEDNVTAAKKFRFEADVLNSATTIFKMPAGNTITTLVGNDRTQSLTNKTITGTTNTVRATQLSTTGSDVVITSAAPPTAGQVLTALTATTAQWSTASGSGVSTFSAGTTGLTPNSATSGVITLSGTLNAVNGGTGQNTYATGDILYASSSTTLAKLPVVNAGRFLSTNSSIPQWITPTRGWAQYSSQTPIFGTNVSSSTPAGAGGTFTFTQTFNIGAQLLIENNWMLLGSSYFYSVSYSVIVWHSPWTNPNPKNIGINFTSAGTNSIVPRMDPGRQFICYGAWARHDFNHCGGASLSQTDMNTSLYLHNVEADNASAAKFGTSYSFWSQYAPVFSGSSSDWTIGSNLTPP